MLDKRDKQWIKVEGKYGKSRLGKAKESHKNDGQ